MILQPLIPLWGKCAMKVKLQGGNNLDELHGGAGPYRVAWICRGFSAIEEEIPAVMAH